MLKPQREVAIARLIEAALDQPKPTPALKRALNAVLVSERHPLALASPREVGHTRRFALATDAVPAVAG